MGRIIGCLIVCVGFALGAFIYFTTAYEAIQLIFASIHNPRSIDPWMMIDGIAHVVAAVVGATIAGGLVSSVGFEMIRK